MNAAMEEMLFSSTLRLLFITGNVHLHILHLDRWTTRCSERTEYLVPKGYRSRTVQPIVSRYTD